MAQESNLASLDAFSAQYSRLIEWLHAEAQGSQWGLRRESFAEALRRSAEKRFRDGKAEPGEVETYLRSLHREDLALACACSEGNEEAWEYFIAHFRQDLRDGARAILRSSGRGDDSRSEELADSLYAELYGVSPSGAAQRKSLFEYFHGRSKLSTWLRAVLAQRHVDLLRATGRTISLDTEHGQEEDESPREIICHTNASPADPHREKYLARMDHALSKAFAGLAARERMILAYYYLDELTLAEIGRIVREHESTVSRQLDRTRRALREAVLKVLTQASPARDGQRAEPGLDEAQVDLAFEYALEEWPFDLSRALSGTKSSFDQREEEGERPGASLRK